MEWYWWLIIGLLIFLIINIYVTIEIAIIVYRIHLVRTKPTKWLRVCSEPKNEEQIKMWNEGIEYEKQYENISEEFSIVNDGLKLYGKFFDNKSDKCVIFTGGRCETLMYAYYYMKPYIENGYSVLTYDPRAHGMSEGIYNTVGIKEQNDLIAFMNYLIENKGIKEIILHGICIGSATSIYAACNENCPSELKGLVLDGPYVTFEETFKNHIKHIHKPTWPTVNIVEHKMNKDSNVSMYTGPIQYVDKIKVPCLFLFSKLDIFSVPEKSQLLFDKCGSENKHIVWFEKGGHSHIRVNNPELYDNSVLEFIKKI